MARCGGRIKLFLCPPHRHAGRSLWSVLEGDLTLELYLFYAAHTEVQYMSLALATATGRNYRRLHNMGQPHGPSIACKVRSHEREASYVSRFSKLSLHARATPLSF